MAHRPRIDGRKLSVIKFSLSDHRRKNSQSSARQQEHVQVGSIRLEKSQEVEEAAEVLHRYLVDSSCHGLK